MNETQAAPRASAPDGLQVYCAYDEIVELDRLRPNPQNPNRHPQEQVRLLANILRRQGWRAPITVSRRSGYIVRGHARRLAGYEAGGAYAPVEYQEYESDAAETADLIADNRIAELAVLDEDAIAALLQEFDDAGGIDPELTGFTAEQIRELVDAGREEEKEGREREARLTLKERFLISPFTVLDARGGVWAERKQAWKALSIRSEIGRGNDDNKSAGGLVFSASSQPPAVYAAKNAYEEKIGAKVTWEEFALLFPYAMQQGGTSIFDPVLCELAYRWFCPQGGAVLDPFAGGSVRGIVAALCGYRYTGADLSARQIEANEANWREISHVPLADGLPAEPSNTNERASPPRWICGDSLRIDELAPGAYDLLFTCPPYGDLEVYSDRPEDISNKDYPEFLRLYREILRKAAAMLKEHSFACVVVGEIRDKKGFYRDFVGDTIRACEDAGLHYYNEAVFIPPYGSLAIRAGRQFAAGRKLGKAHQNVLVFCNGDPAQSAAFDTGDPEGCARDIGAYLTAGAGKLGAEHEKLLVFAKGDPARAAGEIGVPETAEALDDTIDASLSGLLSEE